MREVLVVHIDPITSIIVSGFVRDFRQCVIRSGRIAFEIIVTYLVALPLAPAGDL